MAPIISIQLWRDIETGKEYAKDFIAGLGPERALSVMKTINEAYSGVWFEDLFRDGILDAVESWPDLYVLKVEKKQYTIHLLGCMRNGAFVVVHGVEKTRFKSIHFSHYDTAAQRVMRVK